MSHKETFSFRSADGKTDIHAVYWLPDDPSKCRGVLQLVHGMVEFIERYEPFAMFMADHGFAVAGHDHIGHGASVLSKDDWGYFPPDRPSDTVVDDMHTLRGIVQERFPGKPYFILGHSMGSYMLRKYLTKYAQGLSGAVIMGTGYVAPGMAAFGKFLSGLLARFKGWHYRSMFVTSLAFGASYRRFDVTGKDTSNSWLTKDPEIVKFYYNEPRCTYLFTLSGYKGLFEAVSYTCRQQNVSLIPASLPVLIVSGADDPVGDAGEGVKKVEAMMKTAGIRDLTCKLYENDRHEILNELDRETVFQDLLDWMEKHMA